MRFPSLRSSRSRARAGRVVGTSVLLFVVGSMVGCQSKQGLAPGLSGMRSGMTVVGTSMVGPYLDARLDMAGKKLDAYVLPSDACRALFAPGTTVTYVDNGPLGVYRRDDLECQLMGVGNLVIWRDRRPNASMGLVPRAQAAFRLIHRDDTYALLRGQFPGALRLGFTGQSDLIAVVPVAGECAAVIEQRAASIEYRDDGPRVLSLIGPSGLCDIHGLAQPPPQT